MSSKLGEEMRRLSSKYSAILSKLSPQSSRSICISGRSRVSIKIIRYRVSGLVLDISQLTTSLARDVLRLDCEPRRTCCVASNSSAVLPPCGCFYFENRVSLKRKTLIIFDSLCIRFKM